MDANYWWMFGFVSGIAAILVIQRIVTYLDNPS